MPRSRDITATIWTSPGGGPGVPGGGTGGRRERPPGMRPPGPRVDPCLQDAAAFIVGSKRLAGRTAIPPMPAHLLAAQAAQAAAAQAAAGPPVHGRWGAKRLRSALARRRAAEAAAQAAAAEEEAAAAAAAAAAAPPPPPPPDDPPPLDAACNGGDDDRTPPNDDANGDDAGDTAIGDAQPIKGVASLGDGGADSGPTDGGGGTMHRFSNGHCAPPAEAPALPRAPNGGEAAADASRAGGDEAAAENGGIVAAAAAAAAAPAAHHSNGNAAAEAAVAPPSVVPPSDEFGGASGLNLVIGEWGSAGEAAATTTDAPWDAGALFAAGGGA